MLNKKLLLLIIIWISFFVIVPNQISNSPYQSLGGLTIKVPDGFENRPTTTEEVELLIFDSTKTNPGGTLKISYTDYIHEPSDTIYEKEITKNNVTYYKNSEKNYTYAELPGTSLFFKMNHDNYDESTFLYDVDTIDEIISNMKENDNRIINTDNNAFLKEIQKYTSQIEIPIIYIVILEIILSTAIINVRYFDITLRSFLIIGLEIPLLLIGFIFVIQYVTPIIIFVILNYLLYKEHKERIFRKIYFR